MAESIGTIYNTQIPSYTDAADIKKAFLLYHYGQETEPANSAAIAPNSIAGFLESLNTQIDAIEQGLASITLLTNVQNLNAITATGVYHTPTTLPTIPTNLNYPIARQGIFIVYRSGNYLYQSFTSNEVAPNTTKLYFRSALFNTGTSTWSFIAWQEASVVGHLHNDVYYTRTNIDSKIEALPNPSRVVATDGNGKIVASEITATELSYIAGVTSSIQTQLNTKASTTHYHDDRYYLRSSVADPQSGAEKTVRIFVQSDQPTSATVGDLWIY